MTSSSQERVNDCVSQVSGFTQQYALQLQRQQQQETIHIREHCNNGNKTTAGNSSIAVSNSNSNWHTCTCTCTYTCTCIYMYIHEMYMYIEMAYNSRRCTRLVLFGVPSVKMPTTHRKTNQQCKQRSSRSRSVADGPTDHVTSYYSRGRAECRFDIGRP